MLTGVLDFSRWLLRSLPCLPRCATGMASPCPQCNPSGTISDSHCWAFFYRVTPFLHKAMVRTPGTKAINKLDTSVKSRFAYGCKVHKPTPWGRASDNGCKPRRKHLHIRSHHKGDGCRRLNGGKVPPLLEELQLFFVKSRRNFWGFARFPIVLTRLLGFSMWFPPECAVPARVRNGHG